VVVVVGLAVVVFALKETRHNDINH
jgi:hypothetical protein